MSSYTLTHGNGDTLEYRTWSKIGDGAMEVFYRDRHGNTIDCEMKSIPQARDHWKQATSEWGFAK